MKRQSKEKQIVNATSKMILVAFFIGATLQKLQNSGQAMNVERLFDRVELMGGPIMVFATVCELLVDHQLITITDNKPFVMQINSRNVYGVAPDRLINAVRNN